MTTTRLPAEWEPQEGILLSWPTPDTDWVTNLSAVEETYQSLVTAISRFENVHICCQDESTRGHVAHLLRNHSSANENIKLYVIPYDDTWTRDYGPITVRHDDRPVWLDFRFNAWGNKYPYANDNRVTRRLHKMPAFSSHDRHAVDFVLEGGSIESDGMGSVLTTTRCLMSPQRNPGYDRAAIESRLIEELGTSRILWLEHGELQGDDTDAHIDTLARFCSADTIAYTRCNDPDDVHADELGRMEAALQSLQQANGEPYQLIPLPLPTPCYNKQGDRLPATYANFLIINGAVLVPVYGVETDEQALAQLKTAFPDREIIGIDCSSLLEQYGSLHCVTMHLPL